MEEKQTRGRPVGSGEQLPGRERARKSRELRAQAGATRLDFSLDADSSQKLLALMEHWNSPNRKHAIERALDIVYRMMTDK